MSDSEENKDTSLDKFVWKQSYTWVLLLNAAYIVLFYYLMKMFS